MRGVLRVDIEKSFGDIGRKNIEILRVKKEMKIILEVMVVLMELLWELGRMVVIEWKMWVMILIMDKKMEMIVRIERKKIEEF